MKIHHVLFLFIFCATSIYAQDTKKWDVSQPGDSFGYEEVKFTTNEGTWMNLDVSPDGKDIVFDMLGDIYIMPVSGGKAKALRSGIAMELQPRFSPDGSKISFTSDAGGGDNIWIMDRDGSNAKQVTKETFRLLNNAVWSADGQYLIARKHFTSQRSLGAGEMWMYHISGGSGIQLTKRKNDQQDVNEPEVSMDGKYMYYSEDVYPGGFFQYNKDPNKQIFVIKRYSFEDGKTTTVTGGTGGASRPTLSPDGNHMAFIRRVREASVLFVRDLTTGVEIPLYDKLDKDQQEAWSIFGVYPNFSFTPDGAAIIIWSGGNFKRIAVSDGSVTEIPIDVDVSVSVASTLRFQNKAFEEEFDAKVLRSASLSPDGKQLVFQAAGKIWTKKMPNGKPQELVSSDSELFYEPAMSRDGNSLVFVGWNDEEMGAVYTLDMTVKNGTPRRITEAKGTFRNPSFSPSGDHVVYVREGNNGFLSSANNVDPGIYLQKIGSAESEKLISGGNYPVFSESGERIFYQTGGYFFGSLTKSLKSVDLSGKDERTHISSKLANRFVPSPDNKWVAFIHLHKAYVIPMPMTGKTLSLGPDSKALPVAQVSKDAGLNLHWSSDSETINWTLGDEYFSIPLNQRFTFLEGAPDSLPPLEESGAKIGLTLEGDKPDGIVAFTGARIITMEGDEVIENGTIVIEDNKIVSVGPSAEVNIPSGAFVQDAAGKTIMPGLVDVHAHVGAFGYGILPQKHWPLYANLAFGVTTAHDPSANSGTIFGMSELIRNGQMVGPRLFSTGIILYGAEGDFKAVVNSLDDARSAIRRTKAFGAFSVKSYNQPRRDQRQQIIQAAREYNMLVVPEGGSTFFHNMSMVMDGHSSIEHNLPVAPLYDDVQNVWAASKTHYTPTLIVNYGGMNGEFFYYERDNVWENEHLLKYTPRSVIDARARHRTKVPEREYENGHILVSKSAKKLADKGVRVNLGAHGQLQGLGAHWELWMLEQGGMTEMEALQAATINGAYYLGMENEIGSLKAGKLADLIVIDGNPLENIEDTQNVIYTMVNGRLYDTSTMNELGNEVSERSKFYWETNPYAPAFDFHEGGPTMIHCSCGAR